MMRVGRLFNLVLEGIALLFIIICAVLWFLMLSNAY